MNEVKISVIVPAYNIEAYVEQMMNSILKQTYTDFELIIVDDASKDNTLKELEKYKDSRIKIIRRENNSGGPYEPRADGVWSARGTWIVYLDADDYVDNNYLQQLYDKVLEYDADLCSPQMIRVNEYGKPSGWIVPKDDFDFDRKYSNIEAYKLTVPEWKIGMNGAIIRKTIYERALNSFWKEGKRTTRSDEILSRVLLLESQKGYVASRTKYYYRENENSITSKFNLKNFEWMDTIDDFKNYIDKLFGEDSDEYKRVLVYEFHSYYSTLLTYTTQIEEVEIMNEGLRLLKKWHDKLEWKIVINECDNTKMKIKAIIFKNFKLSLIIAFFRYRRYKYYAKYIRNAQI